MSFSLLRPADRLKTNAIGFTTRWRKRGSKNFRRHDLRHTSASRLQMKGAPLEDIADLLGFGAQEFDDDKTVPRSRPEQAARGGVTAWSKCHHKCHQRKPVKGKYLGSYCAVTTLGA